jgi:hypothetical protein
VTAARRARPRRGTWAIVATLGVVAAVAAACGGGGGPASSGTGDGAHATTAQKTAAHSLNLQAADVPKGWHEQPQGNGPNVVRTSLDTCLVQSSQVATPVVSATSSNFLDLTTGREIGSQVLVYGSTAQAKAAEKRAGSGTMSSCLQGMVSAKLPGTLPSGEKVAKVSVTARPAGASWTFGQRVVVTLSYPLNGGTKGGSTVFIDVLGFTSGTALVEAELESTGSPPPSSLESSTMAALQQRAAAT